MWMTDVAGILLPGEFHPDLRHLHNKLIDEQIRLGADGGADDLGHEIAEEEAAKLGAILVPPGDEVAFVAVVDPFDAHALSIHPAVAHIEELIALMAEHTQFL